MATTVVGDIHGNRAGLVEVLAQVGPELGAGDWLVFVGDYIDRGRDSKGCVDAILNSRATTSASVACLLGNHEDWLRKTKADHSNHAWLLGMDAWPTIESYSRDAAARLRRAAASAKGQLYDGTVALPYELFFETVPREHIAFFDELTLYQRTDECLAVHAGVRSGPATLTDISPRTVVWGWDDEGFPDAYAGSETVVYGHRNNAVLDQRGWPWPNVIGRTVGVDSSRHGVVTAYRLPDGKTFQSNRHTT
jgi:serine/threonine protein phosphatase 1